MSNPLLDLISRGESGAAGYNAHNRGTYTDAHGKEHVRGPGKPMDLSNLTIEQVETLQNMAGNDPNRLFAVGKYQIIPDTMAWGVRSLHLDSKQAFTPEVQDRLFSDFLIVQKQPAVHAYIVGKPGATLEAAQESMAAEWASFADPRTHKSYYDKPGGANHASITAQESAQALNQMRTDYQADIAKGLSPEEAWKAVTDSTPIREQATPHLASHAHGTENLLREGTHGQAVHDLQTHLAHLGYTDHHHKPLAADGHFGIDTRHAVERFQHDHGLAVDGIAGPRTLEALHQQGQAHAKSATPHLDHPSHPDHALYQQAREAVHRLDAQHGRAPDQRSDNLAASLVVAARHEGMHRIDQVLLSDDATRAFAVQGPLDSPLRQIAHVETLDALNTPIAQSSDAWKLAPKPLEPQPQVVQPVPQHAPGLSR